MNSAITQSATRATRPHCARNPLPKEEPIINISVHLSAGAAVPWLLLTAYNAEATNERPGLLGTKGEI
jgi:hypothetical protein